MKGFLPYRDSNLPGSPTFHLADNGRDCRGGYYPPVMILMNGYQDMNMIRHDAIMVNVHIGIMLWYGLNGLFNNFTIFRQQRRAIRADAIRPYIFLPKPFASILTANGNKIHAVLGIIVSRQANLFSGLQLHFFTFSATSPIGV